MGAHGKRRAPKPRKNWRVSGMVVASLIVLGGLVFIGALILSVIVFTDFGSS
ncbi:hypothetical protein ABN028_27710 [Actinopolymorpha sp. B17G11]|uniref:hypothetical protein n=1 Tax=Actinopolymorpha sp. B17G11 TaxID=3160861 RepID=UPI0032E37BCE